MDKRTSTPTRPPEPTSYTVDGDVHTWVFDGGVTVAVCHPHYDRAGRLWGEIVAMLDGVPVNQAQINLLDQRQRIDFDQVAMGRDGRVDWQDYLLSIIPPVQAALDREGGDVDDALGVRSDPWPVLDKKALHGLAGILVLAIDPYTEADPVAVLLNILTAFGNVVGPGTHFRVEHTRHPLRLFMVLVGMTSKGRKGTSWSTPQYIFAAIDGDWAKDRVTSGLSSGEGLIYAVRDERWEKQPIRASGRVVDYQRVLVDEGVSDKRLMIVEEEFSQALKVMSRDGNILSPILRQAWDTGRLHPLTKTNPICASDAHISIIGHITKPELLRYINDVEMANGYANRFLWAMVRRSKKLPNPTGVPASVLDPLIIQLQRATEAAKELDEMRRDAEAEPLWAQLYDELSEGQSGLFGAITARAEVQVMRLAAIYAAMDGTALIQVPHLRAALAVWRYCEASARYIFGDSTGDPVADRIVIALQEGPMARTAIRDLFGRNMPSARIEQALTTLKATKRIQAQEVRNPQGGRPLTVIRLSESL